MLYANFLAKMGDTEAAREQYEEALRIDPDSPEGNYNAGLFFFSQKDFERARELARIAYEGGYPLPGLMNKLKQAGEWR
jgi:Tfp pilus assembly protein PilF